MHGEFHLNMRQNFSVRVTEHRNRLPREVVKSCGMCCWMTLLEQGGWTK